MARDDAEAELTPEEFVGSFRQYGDAVALRTPAGAMTYKELADQVGKARRLLANSSPSSVPRAALTATQDPGALAIFLAAQLQGMALLLLDPRQRPSERSRSAL